MNYEELLKELQTKHYSISAIESLTGGLFASTFVSLPGASKVFKGSIVTYSRESKIKFGVKEDTIKTYGTISSECAKEMALAASTLFESDVSIAFTGNAGPEAMENKSIGLVYIAIRVKDKLYCFEVQLKGDRDKIRKDCVDLGFTVLLDKLKK